MLTYRWFNCSNLKNTNCAPNPESNTIFFASYLVVKQNECNEFIKKVRVRRCSEQNGGYFESFLCYVFNGITDVIYFLLKCTINT
jgi:hypothetical protein